MEFGLEQVLRYSMQRCWVQQSEEARQPELIMAEQSRVADTRTASSSGARHMLIQVREANPAQLLTPFPTLASPKQRQKKPQRLASSQWATYCSIPTGHRQGTGV